LIGAGVHPLGRSYRLGQCGVNVCIAMPDGDTAIRACNGMRTWIPLLQALGANSPYWYGRDSGLASTRAVIRGARWCIPRAFAGYDEFAATVEELRALGESSLHWDVRPNPALGTLEVAALDAQSSLDDLAALIALIHCLAVHEATAFPTAAGPSPEALRELGFRAARDGLDAQLALHGALRPAREVALHAVTVAGVYAADLGCWDELMLVHRLLERGNGAARQRRHADEGGVRLLLRRLADETTGAVSPVTIVPHAPARAGTAAA
jgi:carboxylate-amine ligase